MKNYRVDLDLSTDEVANEIKDAFEDGSLKKAALKTVKKKLGHIFGEGPDSEVHEIAEDALNTVITGLLNARANKTSSLSIETQSAEAKKFSRPIERYLIAGISNYCATRLRRWSTENEEGKTGTRARHYIDSDQADDADFWDRHLIHTHDLDSLDHDRVGALLTDRGVSDQDIALIKRNLSGWSFADIAKQDGGTADKYRRRIQRALKSAGIDPQLAR